MGGEDTVSWRELHAEAAARLARLPFETAPNEARWLVERAAGARLDAVGSDPATERAVAHLDAMVERRAGGEPVQYVLGRWAFRSLDLFVDRRVLIPRPETEVVAGLAVDELAHRTEPRAVDLGTGSGAIALSLAVEVPGCEVWAVERSAAAASIARANTAALGRRGRAVTIVEGDWFAPLPDELRGAFDVVVSNPPYVAADDPLPEAVERWEPADALRAGPDGLDDLRAITAAAAEWLAGDGVLICEIDPRQADAAVELAAAGGLPAGRVADDLTGRPRALVARRG